MSYGQGGPQSQWDPWKPHTQQPWNSGDDGTPDWAALADASATRNKRRRLMFIAGGALATIAVGTAVAMAVVSANGGDDPSGHPSNLPASASLPGGSATATPSFAPTSAPPPLDPKDFISSAEKDTAPLGPETLFPGTRLTIGGTVYEKGATADTTSCATAAGGTLPHVLTANGCTRLIRVSYVKDGIAVTVGVAVFDTADQATRAKTQADRKSIVRSLPGKGITNFCDSAICRSTTNSYGRYAYFTITGFTAGKDVTTKDTKVFRTGDDLAEFAFRQIRRRGEAAASAASG
ncbi:hypothetical protein [Streptomyces sp. NK08204]|uniref:hypothetical protein n=1 Tax=Streptomyces sp. NK08204 TaxID=2873260 RepID=UPI001CEC79A1|nr:hypothetical protein [Streptomyces sp. NK08204]